MTLVDVHAHFQYPGGTRADWAERNASRLAAGDRIGITCHVASILGTWGRTSPTYFPSPDDVIVGNDAMLELAKGLRRTLDEEEKRDNEVAGAMMRLRPQYVALLQRLRKGRVYPDANGTLRVSFGKVQGYSPRDSVQYAA